MATIRAISVSPSNPCITALNTSVFSMCPSVALSRLSASNISPRPISAQPALSNPEWSRILNTTKPLSISNGMAIAVLKLISCTTRVEPTFAPSMTASAGARLSVPAAVKEVAIRLTAVLLCSKPVIPIPASNAIQRLDR
ncbi:hypothetical protein SRABI106_04033 [Rahnella aquatilis]|nr:hypothetical protein SRABI106_04033 [Rahnella aquatilis]